MAKDKTLSIWHAPAFQMLKCPVPECNHKAGIITIAHCRNHHNMTRDQIMKEYGKPQKVKGNAVFG